MNLNLQKYFNQKVIQESEGSDEEYVPSESEEQQVKKTTSTLTSHEKDLFFAEKDMNEERLLARLKDCEKERRLSFENLHQKAKKIAEDEVKRLQARSSSENVRVNFADKTFTLFEDNLVAETEVKPGPAQGNFQVNEAGESPDELQVLAMKTHAINEFLKNLNDKKVMKINSILKSKFDWQAFTRRQNIDDDLSFKRKDDKVFQTFLFTK